MLLTPPTTSVLGFTNSCCHEKPFFYRNPVMLCSAAGPTELLPAIFEKLLLKAQPY